MLSDFCLSVCLSDVCLLRTSGLSREQRGLGRLKLAGTEVAHVTRDSDTTFKVKGHRSRSPGRFTHRRVNAAAVSVGTYRSWKTTATLRSAWRREALRRPQMRRAGAYRGGRPPTACSINSSNLPDYMSTWTTWFFFLFVNFLFDNRLIVVNSAVFERTLLNIALACSHWLICRPTSRVSVRFVSRQVADTNRLIEKSVTVNADLSARHVICGQRNLCQADLSVSFVGRRMSCTLSTKVLENKRRFLQSIQFILHWTLLEKAAMKTDQLRRTKQQLILYRTQHVASLNLCSKSFLLPHCNCWEVKHQRIVDPAVRTLPPPHSGT